MGYTRKEFIAKVGPLAQRDAKSSKILASLTVAQAILESGDGNSKLTTQGNALFGIKASGWSGKVWTGSTVEYYDGNRTNIVAGFRAYDSWEESIADHSALLTRLSRYKAVVGETDYKKACKAIQAAGYATDPNYASKLIRLIETNQLYKYDVTISETKQDNELSGAVSSIINSGIQLDFNSWKRVDLIKLQNVPSLIKKLGGIDSINKAITSKGMQFDLEKWKYYSKTNSFTASNIRSLLIKFAKTI